MPGLRKQIKTKGVLKMKLNNLFIKTVAVFMSIGLMVPSPGYAARQLSTENSPAVLNNLRAELRGMTMDQATGIVTNYLAGLISEKDPDLLIALEIREMQALLRSALVWLEGRAGNFHQNDLSAMPLEEVNKIIGRYFAGEEVSGEELEAAVVAIPDLESRIERLVARSETRTMMRDESILSWKSKHGKSLKQILDTFVKEYDFRGFDGADDVNFPQQVDEELLRWVGNALGSVEFVSRRHGRSVQLKANDSFVIAGDNGPSTQKFKDALIEGLRDAGIHVIDLGVTVSGQLYKSISNLGVQGGLYVTRSHVEVGTNGAKPNINGITLYGEMLQQAKAQILNGLYAKAEQPGTLDESQAIRDRSRQMYFEALIKSYGQLAELLKTADMKVAFNLNSGSATGYADLFQTLFGKDVTLLKSEGDSWARKGLADPTRKDVKALAHPEANMLQYSKDHPDLFVLNFDLDVDRVSLLQGGELYLGDEMFYAVIEYLLTLDPYKELLKNIYPDSRMKIEFGQLVRHFGGTSKRHPKGHSKVKATIDLLFEKLVREGGYSGKTEFLQAHPGFRIVQSEYSLHFFLTSDKGEAFDDALEFSLFWLTVFAKIKIKHKHPDWSYADYIKDLKKQGIIAESIQIKEQRTPMPDEVKGKVMDRMKDAVLAYFGDRPDFMFVPDWEKDYEGDMKPYTLINIEGVYHLVTPLGEIFWGQSNTSPKVAFGTQSTSAVNTRKLAGVVAALMILTRQRVAPQAPGFQPLEMADLFKAWLPETHKLSYEEWSVNHPNADEKQYDAWLGEGLEENILANYPSEQAALSEFVPRAELRYELPADTSFATTEVAGPIDFSKVIADGSLVPKNVAQVRATFTNKGDFQEPLIITSDFAFNSEIPGLPMVPSLAGKNPVVVIVRDANEEQMVADFNAQLPDKVQPVLVAGSVEQAVSMLQDVMADLIRRNLMVADVSIRALATTDSIQAAALKNKIGDNVSRVTKIWMQRTAEVAGLTAMIERFAAELHAISTAA